MKKLFFLFITILIIYGTYSIFKTNKINYIVLGDYISEEYPILLKDYLSNNKKLAYYKNYSKSNNNTISLLEELKYNSILKKDLRESNLVTLSIGINDLFNISSNNYNLKDKVDNMIPNIKKIINEIRKYAKKQIIIVGIYNPINKNPDLERLFAYIDEQYRVIANNYNCIYISNYEINNNKDKLFEKIKLLINT